MSTRSRRSRARVTKTPLSGKSLLSKKSRSAAESDSGSNSRCSTPVGSSSSTPTLRSSSRFRSREAANRSKNFIEQVQRVLHDKVIRDDDLDEADSDFDDEVEEEEPSDHEDELDSDFALDDDGNDDDAASVYSAASYSTVGSTPGRRRWVPRRPKTPEILDEKDIPQLTLPASSTDLILDDNLQAFNALGIYEVLRHYRTILRLSPFRFEDFCASLITDEQCCLLAETHAALLRALLREEDANNTTFGPNDLKDSVNISLYFLDAMTWGELVRAYLDGDRTLEFREALPALEKGDYCSTSVDERLQILQTLTDLFLRASAVREDIQKEGNIQYDDHCRNCHKWVSLGCNALSCN